MDLRVKLIANFNGINAEQWEQAYGESLQLIAQFPSPAGTTCSPGYRGQNSMRL